MRISSFSATAIIGAFLMTGCQQDGTTSSEARPESATIADPASQSAAGLGALTGSIQAANEAVIGSGGASTGSRGFSRLRDSGAQFDWKNTGTLIVDLDARAADGTDLHPQASGTMSISWTGAVTTSQPTGNSGVAALDVTVTVVTPVTFTEQRGTRTWVSTWDSGSTLTYDLDFDWSRTDQEHWTLNIDARAALASSSLRVVDPRNRVSQLVGGGTRRETATVIQAGSAFTITGTATANLTGTIVTDGGPQHTWRWQRTGIDSYQFTWDGVVYGPYSRAQALVYGWILIG
ncbi:hypothetical protein LBMAG53_29270 [Planctomycetota bacterium]|nr:hypothetical protein LBMAG53_29270 [Planctomycetota bacterium]